jgi:hypothetical protein
VHHGNGTQAFFENDPSLFFGSSHQMPCYPGTGQPADAGCHRNVVNCALKPGSGSAAFRAAWTDAILPQLEAFNPELIVVSAGFDAHADDPLADLTLKDDDFYWVQQEIMAVASRVCRGKVVSVLEGGYDLAAIARSAVMCVRAQVEAAPQLGVPSLGAAEGAAAEGPVAPEAELSGALAALALGNGSGYYEGMDLPPSASSEASEESEDSDETPGEDEDEAKATAVLATLCTSKPPPAAGAFSEVASGSGLHGALLKGFERCRAQGLLRSDPTHGMQRRYFRPFYKLPCRACRYKPIPFLC